MEPNFNMPRPTTEQYAPLEAGPEVPLSSPEQAEQTTEQGISAEQAPAFTPPPLPILPQPVTPAVDDSSVVVSQVTVLGDIPDVAADDNLIEKEWVDKAKHIITETADDPHAREQAVSQLQKEYLRRRYGKELGSST